MSANSRLEDLDAFTAQLRAERATWFDDDRPVTIARAPGRLDVMGGIADYTGSLVLEATLDCGLCVAAQPRRDQAVRVCSPGFDGASNDCLWPLSTLYESDGRLVRPERFSAYFDSIDCAWAKYVAGVFYVLLETGRCEHFGGGATLVVHSTIPPGAGVSSSAALEVATCQALTGLLGITLTPLDAAKICQRAENLIVGAPCGIMDQITCLVGEPGTLLQLKCQPHEIIGPLEMPAGLMVIGIDSGVCHSIRNDRYVDTRVAAFMGHRIIREILSPGDNGNDPTSGYLANLTPSEYVEHLRDRLPTKLTGERFVKRFGQSADSCTTVCTKKTYKVRSRTEHHIYENARVHQFAERLSRGRRTGRREPLVEAGQLMYASHWSYGQRCGLSCIETDLLVNLLRKEGERAGVLGAKITGGGSGGTVAVLLDDTPESHSAVQRAIGAYTEKTDRKARIFSGSSTGAHHFGLRQID